MTPERRIWPMALELASCLCRNIEAAGLPEPCFCGIQPGGVTMFDYCDPCSGGKCGMAWVRLMNIVPRNALASGAANISVATPQRCDQTLAATFEVGIARCAPMPDDDGNPPDLSTQLVAAELQFADMGAARTTALCCFTDGREILLGPYVPFGPDGGCLGGAWSVTVGEV